MDVLGDMRRRSQAGGCTKKTIKPLSQVYHTSAVRSRLNTSLENQESCFSDRHVGTAHGLDRLR